MDSSKVSHYSNVLLLLYRFTASAYFNAFTVIISKQQCDDFELVIL